MRYISNTQIKEGIVLARPFYGSNFEILLTEDMALSRGHIKRINDLGYAGVYIKDAISEGIITKDIIPPQLRINTIRYAKGLLQRAERGGETTRVTRENQNKIIQPVIDAIIDNPTRLVDLIDLKPFDDYMYYHTANAVILSLLVGIELGISGLQLHELGMACMLHDVGNIFIPKAILDKPGVLTKEEYEIVKSHSQMGFEYLRDNFDISIEACMGALQHHENYDGTGYPNKLKKDKISIYGRIIAITDVFDALTSRRPYRQPVFPPAAMDFMEASAGTMFDPQILDALKHVIALYPSGCCVELDSGENCIVVENYHGDTSRPKLRLLDGSNKIIDLHGDRSYVKSYVMEIIEI